MKKKFNLVFFILLAGFHVFAQNFNKVKMDSLFAILSAKDKAMGSVAISKNGQLLYTNAIGYAVMDSVSKTAATVQTRYRIGSITKMFTAVIIFQLIDEKKMGLDDKLDKYFPQLPNAAKISIGNLLSHQSGLHNFTEDDSYLSYNEKSHTEKEMLNIIAADSVDFEPGTKAAYSNSNFIVLGYIAEQVTKKNYSDLVKQRIISKLKLSNTYVGSKTDIKNNESFSYQFTSKWKQEPETDMSVPAGAGSILSTPSDLVKFIEGLFAGKLMSDSSFQQMKRIKNGYGMGILQVPFYDKKALGHNGGIDGFGSSLAYFPQDSVAIAYCTNGQVYPMNNILIGILSIYFNKAYILPAFSSVSLNSSDLNKYLGTYSSEQIPLKITITKENSTLIGQATGQPSFPLDAAGNDVFKFDQAGVVIEFDVAKKQFALKQGGANYLFTKE